MTPSAPRDVLALLLRDPGRPRLTWYGEAPERIELSGAVLANWVAKTTNLLVEELDAAPGTTVVLDLPAHWRALVWALAAWSTGATVSLVAETEPPAPGGAAGPGPRIVVTHRPASWVRSGPVPATTDLVAVALPGLARSFDGELPAGAIDAAADTMTYEDVVGYVPATDASAPALVDGAALRVAHAELVPWAREDPAVGPGARVLLESAVGPAAVLRAALGTWAADGSVVLLGPHATDRYAAPEARAHLAATERLTHDASRPTLP